jgi:hypothetical protein
MKSSVRFIAAVALAVFTTLAVGALSRVPYGVRDGETSLVRLSWRYRGEREEECRELSEEELARLPAHMRQPIVCEGQAVSFLLEVTIDGAAAARDTIRAAGARADRPLYVFRELPVTPGAHALRVSLRSLAGDGDLDLDTRVDLAAGEVALVTLDAEGARLVLRRGGA